MISLLKCIITYWNEEDHLHVKKSARSLIAKIRYCEIYPMYGITYYITQRWRIKTVAENASFTQLWLTPNSASNRLHNTHYTRKIKIKKIHGPHSVMSTGYTHVILTLRVYDLSSKTLLDIARFPMSERHQHLVATWWLKLATSSSHFHPLLLLLIVVFASVITSRLSQHQIWTIKGKIQYHNKAQKIISRGLNYQIFPKLQNEEIYQI